MSPSSLTCRRRTTCTFNYWELDYRRLFQAFNDQLDFKAENAGVQEFRATDFTSSSVTVWDISSPAQPKRLNGVVTTAGAGGTYSARFRAAPAIGHRFWMQGENSFTTPSSTPPCSITLRPSTGLRAPVGGADTVIITPVFLRPAAETLATWHRAHGRRTLVADLQDVYDEFNDGIRHPKAVRQMLAWAAANWTAPAPAYLVLMGDGHFNLKNYDAADPYYAPALNPFPPYLIFKDPWLGEIASDGLYGDHTGDDLPDVAVGRIPVNTLDEANVAVNKIVTYDESIRLQAWQQQTLFIADKFDAYAGDFWQLSDVIIQDYTPTDQTVQRIYLEPKNPYYSPPAYPNPTYDNAADAKAAILSAINGGALMVQYTGHGAPQFWNYDRLWTVADAAGLTNGTRLPVFLSFNCMDGYFTYPASFYQSLAETMFRQAGGGSVAATAPSGEGLASDQTALRKILMDTMFKDGVRELGRAFQIAKRDYAFDPNGKYPDEQYGAPHGVDYLVYEMNFFGDPAMRLPVSGRVPEAPVVSIVRTGSTGSHVKLSWLAVTKDTLGANTTVTKYDICRSTQPYFDPTVANSNCTEIDATADLIFVDNAAPIGDVTNNYFYVVRAQNSAGWSLASSSTGSSRTGEFDFALTPGIQ